jgi:hypothetical protein
VTSPNVATVITPSDSQLLANDVGSIYVGTSGNLAVLFARGGLADSAAVILYSVPAGYLDFRGQIVVQVLATGTTATQLVGLTPTGILNAN